MAILYYASHLVLQSHQSMPLLVTDSISAAVLDSFPNCAWILKLMEISNVLFIFNVVIFWYLSNETSNSILIQHH